jgi:ubiquinone/menaquinone biosynthesis C-methylase UbiE
MMAAFHRTLVDLARSVPHDRMLDVGCGEGRTTTILHDALSPTLTAACDLEVSAVVEGPGNLPAGHFLAASVYELPFEDGFFDLAVATEVLEHLDDPGRGLHELVRVASTAVLVTVPNEPWWRIANMARGAYLKDLGNTPGHVQHWTTPGLRRFISSDHAGVEVRTAAMWNMALIRL